jgi:hypothetical protein
MTWDLWYHCTGSGPVVQWSSGPVVQWSSGPVVSGPVVQWSSGDGPVVQQWWIDPVVKCYLAHDQKVPLYLVVSVVVVMWCTVPLPIL